MQYAFDDLSPVPEPNDDELKLTLNSMPGNSGHLPACPLFTSILVPTMVLEAQQVEQ